MTSTGDAGVASDAYTYDSLGRVETVTRSLDGVTTAFAYAPAYSTRDERSGLTIKHGGSTLFDWSSKYDNLGQVEWLQLEGYSGGPTQKADFTYDLAGQTKTLSRTQGANSAARTGFGYDNQGRLVSLSHLQPGANSLAQIARYDMAYDAANRITRIDSSVDEASVYTYDKTGQLLNAQMTFENDEAYAYDSNGNRTSGDTKSNGAHKNLIVEDAKYTFEYDGENNRTKRVEKATGTYQEYAWDHRNRLQEVRFKTATGVLTKTVKYFYDASDMKVREEVIVGASSVNKYFVYDGSNVVLDFVDADGHITGNAPTLDKRYFQGPGVDHLLAQENVTQGATVANRVWWVLPDHLGSTRDIVTSTGGVTAHYQFDSFGNILDGRENVTRYQFTGREHDSNTDLNYHRARWYDPASGKWLSEDPIGFEAGDANVTRYVGNGVQNATDPSGMVERISGGTPVLGKKPLEFKTNWSFTIQKHREKAAVVQHINVKVVWTYAGKPRNYQAIATLDYFELVATIEGDNVYGPLQPGNIVDIPEKDTWSFSGVTFTGDCLNARIEMKGAIKVFSYDAVKQEIDEWKPGGVSEFNNSRLPGFSSGTFPSALRFLSWNKRSAILETEKPIGRLNIAWDPQMGNRITFHYPKPPKTGERQKPEA